MVSLPGQAGNGGRAVVLAQMTNAYILLGGLTGSLIDYPVNLGLLGLRRRLQQNNVICFTYPWGNWQRAGDDIAAHAGLARNYCDRPFGRWLARDLACQLAKPAH